MTHHCSLDFVSFMQVSCFQFLCFKKFGVFPNSETFGIHISPKLSTSNVLFSVQGSYTVKMIHKKDKTC